MAKTDGPRIRKTENSGKLGKLNKNQKKKAGRAKNKISSPFSKVFRLVRKVLSKIVPGFLKGAFYEIRQVTWPDRRETIRLTWAVFVFATIFSIIVAALDFVLDKIFRSIILG